MKCKYKNCKNRKLTFYSYCIKHIENDKKELMKEQRVLSTSNKFEVKEK